ncbi:energy transducer TonB [Simiduia agarivorans]|uniref:TonB1 protein n=1 Tax=Simiduia agarivorans (strain DSM 21679 / JCM 13881 / BCRC 17597 / SA1) TaxID=1117647 RepID=K4KMW7_SIMAS|nr:energy transducer TonB [Simiduia agarivorans]AFV00367.1 tonB1 protein [Simiduia agarivorans SA1 = DSM 21679]
MPLSTTHSLNTWECSRHQRAALALCVGAMLLLPQWHPSSPLTLASSSAAPLASLTLAFVQQSRPLAPAKPAPAKEVITPAPVPAKPEPVAEPLPAPQPALAQPARAEPAPEDTIQDSAPDAQAAPAAPVQQPLHNGPNELPLMDTPLFAEPPQPPRYPMLARRRGQTGTVWLAVTLDANGSPDDLSLLASSGVSALDQAALEAVSQWRFLPYRVDGQALASRVHIPVEFSLN